MALQKLGSVDALSSTLQHGSVRWHLTICNALPYVLEMCMHKWGSSITPGNALAAARHYLREPGAEPEVWNVMP
jgi:hypothetical protein